MNIYIYFFCLAKNEFKNFKKFTVMFSILPICYLWLLRLLVYNKLLKVTPIREIQIGIFGGVKKG